MNANESPFSKKMIDENYQFAVKHIKSNIFRIGIREEDGEFVYLMNEGPIPRKFNVTTEVVYNKTVNEIFGPEMDKIIKPYFNRAFNGEVCSYEMSFNDVTFETLLSPVETNGKIVEVAGSSLDITEKKNYQKKIEEMNLKLQEISITDSLTNLYNRRRFDDILTKRLEETSENKTPFIIIIGDIDNFKMINDKFGHLAGDNVLKELSNLLKQNIPFSGILARWGGEEFSIMITDATLIDSKQFVDILLEKIRNYIFSNSIKITMSFGITAYKEGDNILSIIQRADKALYQSKNKGKNTLCCI